MAAAGRPGIGDLASEADKLLAVVAERLDAWKADHRVGAARPDSGDAPTEQVPDPTESLSAGSAPPAADQHTDQKTDRQADQQADHQQPCTSCPWCRFLATVRDVNGVRPDVTATLIEAATLAVGALQTALHIRPSSAGADARDNTAESGPAARSNEKAPDEFAVSTQEPSVLAEVSSDRHPDQKVSSPLRPAPESTLQRIPIR